MHTNQFVILENFVEVELLVFILLYYVIFPTFVII